MTNLSSAAGGQLRKYFKYINQAMVMMWRLGLGSWGNQADLTGQIMVLTQTGRKSGHRRRTPVNYALYNGDIYCTAGFGANSDWYRNVVANPQVEVWLPEGWWAGLAEDVTGIPEHIHLIRLVLIASGFAATSSGINPVTMSDEELEAAAAGYRLVRIRRIAPRTGPGGPGDLAWVWPVATMLLLPFALRGMGRRKR